MAVIIIFILGMLIWVGRDAAQNDISFALVFSRYAILLVGYELFYMISFD